MCAGATADRRSVRERGAGRGRRVPHPSLHRLADRVFQALGYGDRLEIRVGTTTRHVGSPSLAATRPCPRRHQRDQRHGLPARAREDFDGWEQAGCTGWGWEQVRRSYEQLEELLLPRVPDNTNELSQVFIDAAQEVGFRFNPFFDDGDLEGCGWNRLSIHQGQRHSSYRAFVEPVLDRPNLHVITDAIVDRLEISGSGAVTGLNLHETAGNDRRLAAGEVILCCGRLRVTTTVDGLRHRPGAALG